MGVRTHGKREIMYSHHTQKQNAWLSMFVLLLFEPAASVDVPKLASALSLSRHSMDRARSAALVSVATVPAQLRALPVIDQPLQLRVTACTRAVYWPWGIIVQSADLGNGAKIAVAYAVASTSGIGPKECCCLLGMIGPYPCPSDCGPYCSKTGAGLVVYG